MTFTRLFTFKNFVTCFGVVFLVFGIFFLCWATLTPAFTDIAATRELAHISRDDYDVLGPPEARSSIWDSQIRPYRTNRFLFWDIGTLLCLLSLLCLVFRVSFREQTFPQFPKIKWMIIAMGLLGYGLIIYQFIYSFDSDFERYPAPLFFDAHVRGLALAFPSLSSFFVIIPVIGLLILMKKHYQGRLLIKPRRDLIWLEFIFLPLLMFFVSGFIVSVTAGPASYSAAGFALWVWIILCTRAFCLSNSEVWIKPLAPIYNSSVPNGSQA